METLWSEKVEERKLKPKVYHTQQKDIKQNDTHHTKQIVINRFGVK
jgi:hypothetical protein